MKRVPYIAARQTGIPANAGSRNPGLGANKCLPRCRRPERRPKVVATKQKHFSKRFADAVRGPSAERNLILFGFTSQGSQTRSTLGCLLSCLRHYLRGFAASRLVSRFPNIGSTWATHNA